MIVVKNTKGGVRFLKDVADPREKGKRWKPILRRREAWQLTCCMSEMPRVYRRQKERESFLIREFVKRLGFQISNVRLQECPDVLLTLRRDGLRKRVAIEHTDHHHDTIAGRMSPLTPTIEFWLLVESSLMRRVSHRKLLTGLQTSVKFIDNPVVPRRRAAKQTLARQLAKEIVEFMLAHPTVKGSGFHHFRRIDFREFGAMFHLLAGIRLSRFTDDEVGASRCSLTCHNLTTAHVTVSLDFITSSVASKNKKAARYGNWGGATEHWLLIVCGGGYVNTRAPRLDIIDINWKDINLLSLCRNSPFDKIYVWNKVHSQIKRLK